jgi:hypothetical protein
MMEEILRWAASKVAFFIDTLKIMLRKVRLKACVACISRISNA